MTDLERELLAALKDTLNMLRAAHMSLGMRTTDSKRVLKAQATVVKAEGKQHDHHR